MNKLWRWICGYHRMRVRSPRITAFLNGCRTRGVHLWQIEKKSGLEIRCCIPYSRYRSFCRYCDEFGAETSKESTTGFLPLLARVLLRRGTVLGLTILIIAALILSRFVWFIEIGGDPAMSRDLSAQIAAMGIAPGTPWDDIDLDSINNQLMLNNPGLAYLILKRKGVILKGEIYLTVEPEPFIVAGRHCDIVADRPAVILDISAYEGTPQVQPGEVVKEGQVLIEGSYFRNEEEEPRYVTARGRIKARVWYSASATAPLESVRKEPTGRESTLKTMILGGWSIPLTEKPSYDDYLTEDVCDTPVVGLFFPCRIHTERCMEVTAVTEQESYSAAETAAKADALELALRTVPDGAEVTDTVLSSQAVDGGVEATVHLEVTVDLGTPLYYE